MMDSRTAHSPAGRPYRVVLGPHRQVEPVTPFHGNETLCREVHTGRSVGGHHRKSSLHRDNVHGLPRSIQDEALMFKRSHKFKCLFFLAFSQMIERMELEYDKVLLALHPLGISVSAALYYQMIGSKVKIHSVWLLHVAWIF
jgi:hypothetical protein